MYCDDDEDDGLEGIFGGGGGGGAGTGGGGGGGQYDGGEVRGGLPEAGGVLELRDGEGDGADQGLLHVGERDKGERAGVPLLHNAADTLRQRQDQEHGHPGVQALPAPLRLLSPQRHAL